MALVTRSASWAAAGAGLAARLGVPLSVTVLGQPALEPADPEAFERLYGMGLDGLVLVRPDGHVAWRVVAGSGAPHETEARQRLAAVLARILGRAA